MGKWKKSCEKAQEALWKKFWNDAEGIMENHAPVRKEENWIYWWHAHVLDVLLDGLARNGKEKYKERFCAEYEGTWKKNGNTFLHNWYDDMEWMTLALIRAFDITGERSYMEQAEKIWEDIKTAWNDFCGGGMAWRKDQLDYKNTPANAPAAIIAFRLYERNGKEEDLQWGKRIFNWNKDNLMDKETCFVWDGMNREGDGKIDKDWKFTYCQGVMMGAALEYYRITGDKKLLELAEKIAVEAVEELTGEDGIFNYEGKDDCGLFRGIYFRYQYELVTELEEPEKLKEVIRINADAVEKAMREDGLIGGEWREKEDGEIDLAQHLSGIMVLEMAEKIS